MLNAYGLHQVQTATLALTQSMRQSLAVLQMTAQDVWAYAQTAVETNPLLSWVEDDRPRRVPPVRGLGRTDDAGGWATAGEKTLSEVLHAELGLLHCASGIRRVATYLIDSLDERGYMTEDMLDIASRLGCDVPTVREALQVVQSLGPVGVGARNLRECLLLQMKSHADSPAVALAREIVENHLEALAAMLARGGVRSAVPSVLTDADTAVLQAAIRLIRSLQPRPAAGYATGPTLYAIPEVAIVRVGEQYVAEAVDHMHPRIRVCEEYADMAKRDMTAEDRAALREYAAAARQIVRNVAERRRTLLRVADLIAEHQAEFLRFGPLYAKPLCARQIARALSLHESTISRTVSGKYVETPQGVMEFRAFFSSEVDAQGGSTSARSVQARMKALIDAEDRTNPLTDSVLSEQLMADGIRVSRRTIAKYREQMGIPHSGLRQR